MLAPTAFTRCRAALVSQTGLERCRNGEASKTNYEILVGWSTISLVGRRHSLAMVAAGLRASTQTVPTMGKIVGRYRSRKPKVERVIIR